MTKLLRAKQQFLSGLRYVKENHPHGWMTTEHPDYEKYEIGIVANGKAGFAVSPNAELVSVWSLGGGMLPRIVNAAIYLGAEWLTCYDAGLVEQYEACGFEVQSKTPFNPAFAPADWPGFHTPDFVVMRR